MNFFICCMESVCAGTDIVFINLSSCIFKIKYVAAVSTPHAYITAGTSAAL